MENLTASEIRAIVKSCSENGVSKLSFGNLSIEFTQSLKPEEQVVPVPMEMVVERPEPVVEDREEKRKRELEDLLEEARLANPSLYEDLLQLEDINAGDKT